MNVLQIIRNIQKTFNHKRYTWPLKVLVTSLFVYLVNKNLGYNRINLIEIRLEAFPCVLVFVAGAANFLFQVLRWKLVCDIYRTPIRGALAVKTMLYGNLLAFVTPGKAGELFRGVSIPGANKADAVIGVGFEKLCAGAMSIVMGVLAACFHSAWYGASGAHTVLFTGAAVLVAAALAIGTLKGKAYKFLVRSRKGDGALLAKKLVPKNDTVKLWGIAAYSFAAHCAVVFQTACLFVMFGSTNLIGGMICAFEAYALMIFFPFFIANMGIREYSFSLFLGKTGLPQTNAQGVGGIAILTSVSVLAINMVLPALAGLLWWLIAPKRMKR
jgi:hypothetical protein